MSIIKWKNRSDLMPSFPSWADNFFRDDDFFNRPMLSRMETPAVNIKETENSYMLEVAVPGMKKEDFNVEVKEGMLCISSEKKG